MAKTVMEEMIQSGKDPQVIVQEKGLVQISDSGGNREDRKKLSKATPNLWLNTNPGRQERRFSGWSGDEGDTGPGESSGRERTTEEHARGDLMAVEEGTRKRISDFYREEFSDTRSGSNISGRFSRRTRMEEIESILDRVISEIDKICEVENLNPSPVTCCSGLMS
jgi:hypothetical protein